MAPVAYVPLPNARRPMTDYSKFQIILDTPSDSPALGFDAYATALGDVIAHSTPRFAIGVFGGWGSGKTTLMRQIQRNLDATKTVAVEFSAWRYEKEEHLIVPLLDSVRSALMQWTEVQGAAQPLRDTAKNVASVLGKATDALLRGFSLKFGLPHVIEASFDANKALERADIIDEKDAEARVPRSFYLATFESLQAAFKKLGSGVRIVVFIDDLDRCLPEGALDVLESMKLFFDIDGFVFVVGLDRSVVEKCIDARYAKEFVASAPTSTTQMQIRGEDYIKKIFQVPFNLAPVSRGQIGEYLASICSDTRLPADQRTDIQGRVGRHLSNVSTRGVNPREIKRFINSYVLQMKVKPNLNPEVVLALETIRSRPDWSGAALALVQHRQPFINALFQPNPRDALRGLDEKLDTDIPESFLDYIGPTGAGNALNGIPLDSYLYGSATTRSQMGPEFMDLIRDAAQLRIAIGKLGISDDVRELVSQAKTIESRLQTTQTGAAAAKLLEVGQAISARLGSPPPSASLSHNEDFAAWKKQVQRDCDRLVQLLTEVYQATA
jgi:RecA/RadA recombinase